MDRLVYNLTVASFMASTSLFAQAGFVQNGLEYEVLDSMQHTVAVAASLSNDMTKSYDHGNAIKVVQIKSVVRNDGTDYRIVAVLDGAFADCRDIDRLVIDEGVEEIGTNAFARCKYFEEVSVPSSVVDIAPAAFSGCDRLRRITVAEGNKVYDSRDNCNAVIESESGKLIVGCCATRIPGDVKAIGHSAFAGLTKLDDVELPEGLQTIGINAFSGCVRLKSIKLPESLRTIGESAFAWTALSEIAMPSGVTSIELNPFTGCERLRSITVSAGNKVYDSRNNCNAIINSEKQRLIVGCQTTIVPKGVTRIAALAFAGQTGLTRMAIPKSVESVDVTAFSGCVNLADLSVERGNPVYDSRNGCNAIIETETQTLRIACSGTEIPSDIVEIGEGAFAGMNTTAVLCIPHNIRVIGNGAFRGCGNIRQLLFDTQNVMIGEGCFAECEDLETVQLPDNIRIIPKEMFKDCSKLAVVDIPYDCKIIEEGAFENCACLSQLALPNSIKDIGE